MNEVKKELGDLLLHIVFYAKIGSETNDFDMADVCNEICDKLIHRHPHIYSDVVVKDEEEVKQNWEKLKLKEGKKSVLEGVPRSLPALVKASIAKIIAQQPVAYWNARFAGQDTCVCEVIGLEQAVQDPHFQARGVFKRTIATASGKTIPALPTPISEVFLHSQQKQSSPDLGQHTQEVLK